MNIAPLRQTTRQMGAALLLPFHFTAQAPIFDRHESAPHGIPEHRQQYRRSPGPPLSGPPGNRPAHRAVNGGVRPLPHGGLGRRGPARFSQPSAAGHYGAGAARPPRPPAGHRATHGQGARRKVGRPGHRYRYSLLRRPRPGQRAAHPAASADRRPPLRTDPAAGNCP